MKLAWTKHKHWFIASIIAIAGFGTAVLLKHPLPKTEQSVVLNQQTPPIKLTAYQNNGHEAKDDNFFLPGTFQHLSDLKDSTKPVVVWISASWCETCHYMRPFIWKTANNYTNKLVLKEIDFSDNYNTIVLPNYYFGTPTFVVLNTKGETVSTFYGADEKGFDEQLAKASLIQ